MVHIGCVRYSVFGARSPDSGAVRKSTQEIYTLANEKQEDTTMGKIEVEGYAERTVEYDLMEITIGFYEFDISAKEASSEVMNSCERYLAALKKQGIDISGIRLADDNVRSDSRYFDDDNIDGYCAHRKLIITAPFDMKLINTLRSISDKLDLQTGFNVNYQLSDCNRIKEELKLEAIRNAKSQAETIAASIDLKVTGLISADKNERMGKGSSGEAMCVRQCSHASQEKISWGQMLYLALHIAGRSSV